MAEPSTNPKKTGTVTKLRTGCSRLLRMFGLVGQQHPSAYLLAYVVFILAFALAYTAAASQFYHPYVKYEASMYEEATEIRDALTSALQAAAPNDPALSEKAVLLTSSIQVATIRPDESHVRLNVRLEIWSTEKGGGAMTRITVPLRINPSAYAIMQEKDGAREAVIFPQLDGEGGPLIPVAFAEIFGSIEEVNRKLVSQFSQLRLQETEAERIKSFSSGFSGFPHGVRGTFFRMLYLSVVTITTLGYGDIVPITGFARLLIGLEATSGIILLGLFVNSLGKTPEYRVPR